MKLAKKSLHCQTARRRLALAYLLQAKMRRAEGNVPGAVDSCKSALRFDASDPDIHLHHALNLMTLQHESGSIAALHRVKQLRPLDPTARHLLNALQQRPVQRAPAGYVKRLFNRFAATFDHRMNSVVTYRLPNRLAECIGPLARQRSGFDSAIDLGCGTGLSGKALRPHIQHLIGVDLSRKMLNKASEKRIYDVLVCDDIIHFLDGCGTTFDLIVAADVFIYVGDLASTFRIVQKRLDPAGIFAFSTERTRGGKYRLKKSGRFAHSENYIRQLAEKNGLTVLTQKRIKLRLEHHQWVIGDLFLLGGSLLKENQEEGTPPIWKRIVRFLSAVG